MQSVSVTEALEDWTEPPETRMAPPLLPGLLLALPWTRRRRVSARLELAVTSKMRVTSPPEMVMPWASALASMAMAPAETFSEPEAAVSVIVWPFKPAAKSMESAPAAALASMMAWRSEPGPESRLFVTVKTAAPAGAASASAARTAGRRAVRQRGKRERIAMGERMPAPKAMRPRKHK